MQNILQEKSLSEQVIFRLNSFMKNNTFFKGFWKFEPWLNPSYSELCIRTWFKDGMYTPHEILTSTYGMELKLELVLVFDRSRR